MKDPSVISGEGSAAGPGSTSTGLLDAVKARDPVAWQRLTSLYGPLVYSWARRAGLHAEDAADLVQEVFLSLVNAIGSFRRQRPGDSFRAWLWTISRNKLNDHWRRRGAHPEAAGGSGARQRFLLLADEPAPSGSGAVVPGGMSGLLQRALELVRGEFEERTWQAFWQVAVGNRRPADVAAELGMSVNAVYVARSRVLRRLRDELGVDLGD